MTHRVGWRRLGLVLQVASLSTVGLVIAYMALTIVDSTDSDPHGYTVFFGSILIVIASMILLIGVLGLVRWWRGRGDTVLIAYDVFALLLAASFIQVAIDDTFESGVLHPEYLAPFLLLAEFMLLTGAAALAVYRSRAGS